MRVLRTAAGLVMIVAGVMVAEVAVTLSHTYLGADDAVAQDATYGSADDPLLTLWILGDSTSAGVGATGVAGTVSAHLAAALAAQGRFVRVVAVGVSGAVTGDLAGQVSRLPALDGPTVALVQIGANDATHLGGLGGVRSHLSEAVQRLTTLGAHVVVATCPDLGAARPFPQPLRLIAAARGRAVAHAEADVTRSLGGIVVPLAALTGPAFRADARLLGKDRFHPSDAGYALWASKILPFVEEAVGA